MNVGRTVAVALLLLMVPVTEVLAGDNDDAGTGLDAPDVPDLALNLGALGTYSGSLSPDGDADWYAFDDDNLTAPGDTSCFTARGEGDTALADQKLRLAGLQVQDELNPDRDPHLGLAVSAFDEAKLGFEPLEGNQSTGNYTFTADVLTPSDIISDPGEEDDAPETGKGQNLPRVSGACFGGLFTSDDTADRYTLQIDQNETLSLTFIDTNGTDLQVQLFDPDGQAIGPFNTTDTVHSVDVSQTGNWTLEISRPSSTDSTYLIGTSVSLDPEEEERECRPYCFLLE